MKNYDLFEEIGKLSAETIQVCEPVKSFRRTFMPYIAAVLSFTILTAGILCMIKYAQAPTSGGQPDVPPSSEPAQENPGGITGNDSYAIVTHAPVPAFGLAPLDSKTAKLLSENVIFTRDTTRTITPDQHYNVEMCYTVELTEKTKFVLPSTVISYGYEGENLETKIMTDKFTEIYVNGNKVDFRAKKHHNAALYQRHFELGNLQSVEIYPDYVDSENKRQMDDTYELLIEAWNEATQRPEWWYSPELPSGDTARLEAREEHVDMNTFTIEEPGTYTIEIKIVAIGNSANDNYPIEMIQWIDSPRSMWSDVGERNLTIVIDDEEYPNTIEDGVCDFEIPKKEQ